jgi:hypothetical protein
MSAVSPTRVQLFPPSVMAGLDPAIHVDHRVKPGDDEIYGSTWDLGK